MFILSGIFFVLKPPTIFKALYSIFSSAKYNCRNVMRIESTSPKPLNACFVVDYINNETIEQPYILKTNTFFFQVFRHIPEIV